MKKALKSLAERHVAGGIASLEHPHNSYTWYTEEVEEKLASGDWYLTCYSHCCFGGQGSNAQTFSTTRRTYAKPFIGPIVLVM